MKFSPFAALIPAAALLSACGPQAETAPASSSADTAAEPAPPSFASEFSFADAPLVIEGAEALMAAFAVKEGLSLVPNPQTNSVRLSGDPVDARAGGRTGGARITIDPDLEAAWSGGAVEVLIVARSQTEGALLSVYSTVEHPNDGWQGLRLGQDFTLVSFQADLPEMERGLGDVVGFRPWEGPVDIAAIAVRPVTEAQ